MKIGDKVKFLSETGGGKIAGFKGKNIVLVEDEDGFQIPTPINEVVVVSQEDYSTANVINRRAEAQERKAQETPLQRGQRSVKAMMQDGQDEPVDMSVADTVDTTKEITFRPQAEERKGGNLLSAYLAFVPDKDNSMDNPHFEVYFVNDSNYFMFFTLMGIEGNSYSLITKAEVEPNTKIFIQEMKGGAEINHVGRVAMQIIAYKRDKPFTLKEPVGVEFRLEPLKFYKVHTFEDTPFFDVPALIYTLIENDKPMRPLVVDAKQLKKEMYAKMNEDAHKTQTSDTKHSHLVHHRDLDNAEVIDLHADALLDTTAGMSPGDILEYQMKVFRDQLAKHAGKKGQKLIFIHGKGAGVLRRAIVNELKYKHKSYTYQDASFQEYGYGATQVIIH